MSLDNVLPMSLDSFVTYVLDPYSFRLKLLNENFPQAIRYPGQDCRGGSTEHNAHQEAAEVKSIVLVTCHPYCPRKDNPIRLDGDEDKPICDQKVKHVEYHQNEECG